MRVSRIHTVQPLEPGGRIVLEGPAAHYLGRVLRVAAGHRLTLFNGDGYDYAAEVERVSRGGVELTVNARLPGLAESPLSVTVVQGVSRGERMDQTLQKCTELGVAAFLPVFCERSEVRLSGDKLARRLQHWQAVVIAACEQSGRCRVPQVLPPRSLADWLAASSRGNRIALTPAAERPLARIETGRQLELAVGPEGGFSDPERAALRNAGVVAVSLGPRVLRTETAAPAAVAILQYRDGDLG